MDAQALPILRKQAARFLNWDLNTRVMAPFSNFYSACNSNGSQLTDCIVWDSQIAVHSGATAAKTFNISDMSGGCGNAHFYANTTGTYSYDANTPDPMVLSSCEHYGLHDGANGKDMTTPYTNKMTDDLRGRSRPARAPPARPTARPRTTAAATAPRTCTRASRATARRRRTTTARPCTTGGCICSTRERSQRARGRSGITMLAWLGSVLRFVLSSWVPVPAGGTLRHGCRRRGSRGRLPCPAVLAHDRLPPRFDPSRHRRPDRAGRDGRLAPRRPRIRPPVTAENSRASGRRFPEDDAARPVRSRIARRQRRRAFPPTPSTLALYGQLVALLQAAPASSDRHVEVADHPATAARSAHRRVVRLPDQPARAPRPCMNHLQRRHDGRRSSALGARPRAAAAPSTPRWATRPRATRTRCSASTSSARSAGLPACETLNAALPGRTVDVCSWSRGSSWTDSTPRPSPARVMSRCERTARATCHERRVSDSGGRAKSGRALSSR